MIIMILVKDFIFYGAFRPSERMLVFPSLPQNSSINEHSLSVCRLLNECSYSRVMFLLVWSKCTIMWVLIKIILLFAFLIA